MNSARKYIKKYSDVINVSQGGNTVSIKGIIQPFHYHNKSYFSPERFPAGVYDGRHYLLITTAEYKNVLNRGSVLERANKAFNLKSVETYRVKNEDLYVWAVLTARTENTGDVYE